MKWLSENAKRAAVPALTVAFGILLYELLEHFAPVREAASALFRVAAPVWYDPAKRFREQEKDLVAALVKGIRG